MMQHPDISIIIPARNEALHLPQCLAFLEKLEGEYVKEIIVVNNGSTDETRAIAEAVGAIVIDEPIAGVGRARRLGTAAARGTYILHIDADTRLPPSFLIQAMPRMRERSDVSCLGGQCVYYDAPKWKNALRAALFFPILGFAKIASRGRVGSMGNCMMFRKADYAKTDGFDASLRFGEDADLCRKLSVFGKIMIARNLLYGISARRFYFDRSFLPYAINFFFLCFTGRPRYNELSPAHGRA